MILFHGYHLIADFTVHGRRPLDENKNFLCLSDPDSVSPGKLYTRKNLLMTETYISDFHTSFFIQEIQKLAFHLPLLRIPGIYYCGKRCREAFNHCIVFRYVLFHRDYSERVVANFSHQIQSGYYGGNIYLSIEFISLENSNAKSHPEQVS